jgi:autotransporter-associated beta strand protein/predicted outer membrane repeat protein
MFKKENSQKIEFRLRAGLWICLFLAAAAGGGAQEKYDENQNITINSGGGYPKGIWLGQGALTFTGDAPGAFGSQSTVRNNTPGQIIVGRYRQGGPLDTNSVTSHINSVTDLAMGYRIQILALEADLPNYLSYSLGMNTGGRLLTISGVQNLSNDPFNWTGNENKTGLYKYGGAIGVYGSVAGPGSDYANEYRSWNSFLVFAGGSKLRLFQNEAQYGGGLGFYKQGNADWGGYYFDFKPLAYLDISENTARGDGGGMYFFANMEDTGTSNAGDHRQLVVDLGRHSSFTKNSASGAGGGLALTHDRRQVELIIQGDTFFKENTAGTLGGAIYIDSGQTQASSTNSASGGFIVFDATSGVIAFSGNKANGRPNAVHAERNTLYQVRAVNPVYFDDPLSSGPASGSKGNSLTKTGAGILQFAGGDSVLNSGGSGGGVSIEQGAFRVVKGSSFSTAGNAAVFNMSPTTQLAGGGVISAENINLSGVTINPDSARLKIPEFNLETNTFSAPSTFIEAGQKTGVLTLKGTVYLNGTTLEVDVADNTEYDALAVTGGGVSFAGANVVKMNSWREGRYQVLTVNGSGTINSIAGVTAQAGWAGVAGGRKKLTPGLSADQKTLYVDMLASNAVLTWAGAGTSGIWDRTETNKAWTYSGGPDGFLTGDYVVFTGAAPEVDIPGELEVFGMEINAGQYTFNNGRIRGLRATDPLIKEFHDFTAPTAAGKTMGTLTVSGVNTTALFTNPVDFAAADINSGAKVTITNQFKISGGLVISGAGSELVSRGADQLLKETPYITVNNGGALVFNKIQDFTYPGNIAGSGGILRKLGPGAMTLTGNSGFTGTADIGAGSLILTGSIGNAVVTMAAGTLFDLSGASSPTVKGLSGAGKVALGTGTLTVEGGGDYRGIIEGAGGLTKAGGGDLILSGANTYTGITTVRDGTLALAGNGGITPAELKMEGGNFDISAMSAAASPLTLEKLSGSAGTINIGTRSLGIGNSPVVPDTWIYKGNFTGDRVGNLDINAGAATLRLEGASGQLYQGSVNVNTGTLELSAGDALEGTITVNAPGALILSAPNALAALNPQTNQYESKARIDLRGTAELKVAGSGIGYAQHLERLVSGRDSRINLFNAPLVLKSGVLEGTINGVAGLIKSEGAGFGMENTLSVAANLNPDSNNNPGNIGDFTIESSLRWAGNAVELRDGVKLAAGNVSLGDYSMLSLSATGDNIITAANLTIGEHWDPSGKGLGTIINITNYRGQANYDLIKVSGGSITGEFEKIYLNGAAQPGAGQLTVRNYFAPVTVTYDTAGPDKYVRVNSQGLLWKAVNDTAHGYFWINEGSVITITEDLVNNSYVMGDTNTGDMGRRSLKDDTGRYWDGKTLIKEGKGVLALDPAVSNLFTGDVEVRNGVLRISKEAALAGAGKITVSAGAAFNLDGYGGSGAPAVFTKNISGSGDLLISGGSVVDLAGPANDYTGSTIIDGAALGLTNIAGIARSRGIVLGGGGVLDISGIGVPGSPARIKRLDDRGTGGQRDTGAVRLGLDQASSRDLEIGNGAGGDSSFTGTIEGWGRIVKAGDYALRLGGANTFTGPDQAGVIFRQGVLILSNNRALGNGANHLSVEGGSKLVLERVEIDNPLDLKNRLEIFVDEYQDSGLKGRMSFHGAPPSDYLVKKTGPGALTLHNENTCQGNTLIEEGTLVIAHNQALGTGRLLVAGDPGANRTLRLEKPSAMAADLDLPTDISLQDNAALNIEVAAGAAALSGVIQGKAPLTKLGGGTLVFTGPQAYTGSTQVLGGSLALTGGGDISASSDLLLNYGALFDISGIAGNGSGGLSGGPMSVGINGLSGSGNIELGEHTLRINTGGGDSVFSGIITSAAAGDPARGGGIVKTGEHTLILYGQSLFTGLTGIEAGTLQLEENNALAASRGVVVEKGAGLIANGSQSFNFLESRDGSRVSLRDALLYGGRLEGAVSAVNISKEGPGKLILDTNVTNMFKFDLAGGELAVRTGTTLTSRDLVVGSGTKVTVSVDPKHAGENLAGAAGSPIIKVESLKIAPGAAIYVDGFNTYTGKDGLGQYLVLRSETPIDGMFDIISFAGSSGSVSKANEEITINVFHNGVGANKSFDGKEIFVVDRGLVWFNSASNTAHGTFMVTGEVTISANLSDRRNIAGEIFLRSAADPSGRTSLWDGKTLTKRGPGVLTLTGVNTYEDTVIEEGTVVITRGATLQGTTGKVLLGPQPGTAGGPVSARPTLVLDFAGDDYFSTPIIGGGDLVKRGPGAVALTGASEFSGDTIIEEGILALGASGAVKGGGKLTVGEQGAVAVATLAQIERGRRAARGETAGTPGDEADPEPALTAELKEIDGSGAIFLYGENTLRVTGTTGFAGSLAGTGVIEQYGGANTLTLSGVQEAFRGTLAVNGNKLILTQPNAAPQASIRVSRGTLESPEDQLVRDLYLGADRADLGGAVVDLGDKKLAIAGALRGNGLVKTGELVFVSGGLYAPGNSPGTVRVEGDLTFETGSVYQVNLDINDDGSLGDTDLLQVAGKVTLREPRVELDVPDIGRMRHEHRAVIISAEGGGTGRFQEWDYVFFEGDYRYESWVDNTDPGGVPVEGPWNQVVLTVRRSKNELTQYAKSRNQRSLVGAITGSPESNPDLFRDLMLLRSSREGIIEPFLDTLTGEIYADLPALIEDIDWGFGKNIRNRFRHMDEARGGRFPVWTGVEGGPLNHGGDGNAADIQAAGAELEAGLDFGLGGRGFGGAAFRGGWRRLDLAERQSSGDILGFGGALYGGAAFPLAGSLKLGAGGTYGMTLGNLSRTINTIINETQESAYTAHSAQALLDLGWECPLSEAVRVEPYAGASLYLIWGQPFSETKRLGPEETPGDRGRAPLDGDALFHWNAASLLGVRSRISVTSAIGFEVGASWRRLFGELTPKQMVRMPRTGRHPVWGAPLNDNAVDLELGLEFTLGTAKLNLGYNLDLGRSVSHRARLGLGLIF